MCAASAHHLAGLVAGGESRGVSFEGGGGLKKAEHF